MTQLYHPFAFSEKVTVPGNLFLAPMAGYTDAAWRGFATKWGADLCLCGHVHGGLMRLPLIGGVMGTRPNLFPKYSGGRYSYSIGETDGNRTGTMVLTCGLGTHTLPIRIFNPGEISVIELQAEESA